VASACVGSDTQTLDHIRFQGQHQDCNLAYSIWGGGALFKMGVIDDSGGSVIHLSAGTAGFVGAWWIGPPIEEDFEDNQPNNILMMLVGAGIL
jgi:ammonium transporter, Amt family